MGVLPRHAAADVEGEAVVLRAQPAQEVQGSVRAFEQGDDPHHAEPEPTALPAGARQVREGDGVRDDPDAGGVDVEGVEHVAAVHLRDHHEDVDTGGVDVLQPASAQLEHV